MRKANTLVGSPVERIEDLRFLRGRGQYVDDLNRDSLLHAVILRSSIAHGRIRSIDASAARACPGVHAVIAAADIGTIPTIPLRQEQLPPFERYQQPVIANEKVRYVGEPIAVVVAESAAIAEDALESIVIDIESLPAVPDRDTSRLDAVILFENAGTNLAATLTATSGDADKAFKTAAYSRREKFSVHRHSAIPMEGRGLLAEWDPAQCRLTVFGAAKVAFTNRRVLAHLIGLSEESIVMMESDVGGGFGVRGEFYPEDFLVPFAARYLGRSVKWIEDRREHLTATNHARDVECEIEIACDQAGTVCGLRGRAFADVGAYLRTNGATAARNIAQVMSGPYRIPNIHVDVSLLVTNKTPAGTYRGPGRYEVDFFRERLFDIAARDLGVDRVEFRRRNLIAEAEMPYKFPTVVQLGLTAETDTGDYQATLDRCLAEVDWSNKAAIQGRLIGDCYHGAAIGCFVEGGAPGPREHARIRLEADGRISLYVGSSAIGQGIETIFAQIAADALEIPMDCVRGVFHGSTSDVQDGFGTFGSRSTVMGGSAVLAAAANLKDAIRAAAAIKLECAPEAVSLNGAQAVGPGKISIAFAQLAGDGICADGVFINNKRTYSYGAHAAYVAVNPRNGHVELLDYVAVHDVGRIINPMTLRGQTIGAIVQGLGGTFLEHFVYDQQAQFLTGSLADYLLPTATDFPKIRVFALEEKPSPHNPLGAKGAGEGGIIPVGGVVANAVSAALEPLGVEIRDLPLSPSRVWELIQAAQK